MRFHPIVSFLPAILLTSCANQGVIVRKDSGPMPFYESLGIDGSYKFAVRDGAGSMHRQLVTPEVFERYAVGQNFNDLEPAPTQSIAAAGAQRTSGLVAGTTTGGRTLAAGRSSSGNRSAASTTGSGRGSALVKSRQSSSHMVASARKSTVPAAIAPEPEIPAVSATFSVGVQQPTSMHLVASNQGESATAAVRPKIQIGPNAHSVAAEMQRSVVTTAPTSRVALTARKIPSRTTIVSSTTKASLPPFVSSQTRAIPSSHVAFVTQRIAAPATAPAAQASSPGHAIASSKPLRSSTQTLATSKNSTSKKGAKRTPVQTKKPSTVDSSRSAHAVKSGQVALVR
jgi:hypothetical protein